MSQHPSIFGLVLATLFVWTIGLLYFWQLRTLYRTRTDRVSFGIFPVWQKSLELESGGAGQWFLRILKWAELLFNVLIGIPIVLFIMGLLPAILVQQLMRG